MGERGGKEKIINAVYRQDIKVAHSCPQNCNPLLGYNLPWRNSAVSEFVVKKHPLSGLWHKVSGRLESRNGVEEKKESH